MTLREIVTIVRGRVLSGSELLDTEVEVGCGSDLMSDVLAFIKPDSLLLTGLTNSQVIRTAEMADIKAVCFVRGKQPGKEVIALAKEKEIVLLATSLPMFDACGSLYQNGLIGYSKYEG